MAELHPTKGRPVGELLPGGNEGETAKAPRREGFEALGSASLPPCLYLYD